MVDAAASFSRDQALVADGASPARSSGPLQATVKNPSDYRRLAEAMLTGPAQAPAWVEGWARHVGGDGVVASLASGERSALTLALSVTKRGFFKIAGFPGESHANGNFPALDPRQAPNLGQAELMRLVEVIAAARPDIDVLALERIAPSLAGVANPLLALPHRPSPNIALALRLEGGFDRVVERVGAKRRRKKTRGQIRKFEAAGGYRRYRAETAAEVDALAAIFFEQKAERFRKLGVRDVFAETKVRAFFRDLFISSLAFDRPPFQLHALEVGGKVRAVTGGCLLADRMTCEFGAIVEDELVHASPGDFLFHENIREACEQGLALYDFSVGDEFYKRQWCDVEIHQVDILLPLTAKGRTYAASHHAISAAKAAVKNNPRLWSAVKWLRRRSGGAAPVASADRPDED
ncbi:MAG: GNAT family N-acetyltransferase [Rhizobiaceae bacterium]|nr:GNAT family N-acetyltransferase [Rhizobiaceae bacterium]